MTHPIRTCGCGCGAPVVRRYLPGHDAKHKGALTSLAHDESTPAHIREQVVSTMIDADWGYRLHADVLHNHPVRDPAISRRARVAHPAYPTPHRQRTLPLDLLNQPVWFVAPPTDSSLDPAYHADIRCADLTRTLRTIPGMWDPKWRRIRTDRVVRVSAVFHTPDPDGWDVCRRCTLVPDASPAVTVHAEHIAKQVTRYAILLEASSTYDPPVCPAHADQHPIPVTAHRRLGRPTDCVCPPFTQTSRRRPFDPPYALVNHGPSPCPSPPALLALSG